MTSIAIQDINGGCSRSAGRAPAFGVRVRDAFQAVARQACWWPLARRSRDGCAINCRPHDLRGRAASSSAPRGLPGTFPIRTALQQRCAASSIAALLLLAVLPVGLLEAQCLSGRVLDPAGAVVVDARLRLFDRNSGELRETRSESDGTYAFRRLPEGDYIFEGESETTALAGSQQITIRGSEVQDLRLMVSGSNVEVVVTASSTPLTLQEVAKALDVVDSEDIGLRNEFSLSEAIRSIPGLRVQQLRGPGSLVTVQTRGLRNHDTAVLIDGLRFRDAASPQGDATAFYSTMNLVNVDRVEFLRGSGSSLYGSHAIGGVMNVSTHQGGGRPHGELRAEGGGLGMLRGVGRVGGGVSDNRLTYSGGISHLNVTRGYRKASPYHNTSARSFAKHSFSPGLSLSGRVWGSDASVALTESPTFTEAITANFPVTGNVPTRALPVTQLALFEQGLPFDAGDATFIPAQTDPDQRQVSSLLATAVSLQHQLTAESSYRLAYQFVDTNRSFQDGPAGPSLYDPAFGNESRFDGQTHTFQARADHRAGTRNLVSLGYELEDERYLNFNTDQGPAPAESRIDIDQASHAIFAQDQIRLLEGSLHLSLSGRAQYFDPGSPVFSGTTSPYEDAPVEAPGSAYTGDLSVAYFLKSSQTKLRAHAGNAFRAPSLYERFGGSFSSYSGSFSYWGDPRLDPESSVAVDAGLDQWLYGSKLRLSGTFFYTNLQQTVIFDFANFPRDDMFGRFGGYRTSSGGVARGVELSSEITPTASTRVRGAYTFTNADSRTPTIGADFFQIPGLSEHVLSVSATTWVRRRFNVTFDLFAVSDFIQSPFGALGRKLQFAGPVKADIVLRYDLPVSDTRSLEVYGKVENVFDGEYYEDGFGSPGAWMIGGVRFVF